MSQQFLLHFPDGTQYGPVDRATLDVWRREGRLPEETLVWPEGAPEWMSLSRALEGDLVLGPLSANPPAAAPTPAPAAARPAAAEPAPVATKPKPAAVARPARTAAPSAPAQGVDPNPQPSPRVPAFDVKSQPPASQEQPKQPAGLSPVQRRRLMLAGSGVLLVVVLVLGMLAVLRPYLAKRRAIAEVRQYALAERRVADPGSGLIAELPGGWLALRNENPYVVKPGARLRLAEPAKGIFGAVSLAVRPAMIDDLDAHLAELLQQRLARLPSQREVARGELQLGRGRGRVVRTTWEEDLAPMQGATVAWADGYNLFSLEAWASASLGDSFATELEELCKGLTPSGQMAARVDEAVERLAVEVPELSKDALRLLVAGKMSQNLELTSVPRDALRAVSRGLDALDAAEASEMRAIYQQIWEPVAEEERVRLASLFAEVKAGRPVAAADAQALRDAVRNGVHALPEAERTRLQELSGRAVRKSLLLP